MKLYLFLPIFILLCLNANADWQTYQNDLRNTGASNGTGYFPLKTANFSDDSLGMNFQPLVDDLDNDGKNEIVIFSNDSLIILNPQLIILNQSKIGSILGQPTLLNFDNDNLIEIIFNARQNITDYFFAYQFNNSNLKQEFNITLSNEANFSGIKCLNLNGTNSCVFKDTLNYVHIINMSSKTDSSYSTSIYNETRQTIPAIGDIDNDGNYEAVFWFNNDSGGGYGFLAFDLNNRNIDWVVDNIFSSIFGSLTTFSLKGHPVLVDLNNDNKLEIAASVFYDDNLPNTDSFNDWFTELFVYDSNGSKLFSKCEKNPSGNCNDGVSTRSMWEGTNPFILDVDNNGLNDICLVKDKKIDFNFKNMTINCFNYSGDLILDSEIVPSTNTIKTATIADINNDGNKEIITENHIYARNGSSILELNLGSNFIIPVDIDGNKGLDLIWTFGNQTKVFLDNNNYSADLSVSSSDISFYKFNKTHVNISAIIKNIGQVETNNIKTIMYNTETLENNTALLNIKKNGNAVFSAILGLKEGEKVLVSADFDNEINETEEKNNFAFKEFQGLPYVFVSADLEPFNVNSEFKEHIKNKLTSGYYTENENFADVKVYIGKNNPINVVNNVRTLDEFEFGYDFGNIIFNDKTGTLPYNSLIGAFKDNDGKIIVMIVGNEIEGDIIGAKELIKNQALFLSTKDKESVFVDDENADAIKVFDYLHLGGNSEHYNINNNEFKKIVKNALNDEMFNVFDKNVVSSNGITLRLRNLKPNISNDYLEYLNSSGVPIDLPVVLAHGLFSNLTTWEVLGAELSNIGRDTWLIEITGGPSQDCDDCIDYTFYNLTDIFVPALLNGVLNFTNKDKIQYVGFSNGCRAALDSLERNKFDSNKVETFVAVGCPGGFEGESLGSKKLNEGGALAIAKFKSQNKKHLKFDDVVKEVIGLPIFTANKEKISLNLFIQYYNFSSSKEDQQPAKNLSLNKFYIIQGAFTNDSDLIVTTVDENAIYENINANKKQYFSITATHIGLDDRSRTKTLIRKFINNETLSWFEKTLILKSSS